MPDLMPGLDAVPNLHPLFVHLPLTLWPLAFIVWTVGLVRRRDGWLTAGRWLCYVALLTSVPALLTGLGAEESLGHDSPNHDAVHAHKTWMIIASIIGLLATVAALVARRRGGVAGRVVVAVLLGSTSAAVALGGDRGALLVYGYGIGTRAQPTATEHGGSATPPHGH